MNSNPDFSKIKAFVFDVDGVLSPSTVPVDDSGELCRMGNVKDGYAMQLAVRMGYKVAIISGAISESIRHRFALFGISDVHLGVSVKLPKLMQWLEESNLTTDEVAFFGDDIPDYESMKAAGLSVAPADAANDILQIADIVTPCNGGNGVARYVIEMVMRSQGKWMSTEDAFKW